MAKKPIDKVALRGLYNATDIKQMWNASQNLCVINHPQQGLITPNNYRTMHRHKPCPYCAQKMVHGELYRTSSRKEAINRGYEYLDKKGRKVFNQVDNLYFHPHYVTIDHVLNKARFPEKMFLYDNLQVICWKCNNLKGDDNSFDLQHTFEYLDSLAAETLNRYIIL